MDACEITDRKQIRSSLEIYDLIYQNLTGGAHLNVSENFELNINSLKRRVLRQCFFVFESIHHYGSHFI